MGCFRYQNKPAVPFLAIRCEVAERTNILLEEDKGDALIRISGVAVGVANLMVGMAMAFGTPAVAVGSGLELPLSPVSQQNAVSKAMEYLNFTSFSRQGLIEQLVYDEFSTADAVFAVDSISVDWNEQAAKKAAEYLNFSSFSRGGLIDQLVFDGFTQSQAQYGVSTTGL